MRIFLAGASGVIGGRLIPQLLGAGHQVTGTSRSEIRASRMTVPGLRMVVVNAFDRDGLVEAMRSAEPDIVIDQLTDLSGMDPDRMDESIVRNARLRDEGTTNVVIAAREAGARRIVVQSIAWAYAPGTMPFTEEHALDVSATGSRLKTVEGIVALEQAVLGAIGVEGVVLRYGQLYGPATGTDIPKGSSPVHVDAAARAALLAVNLGPAGIYNVTDHNQTVSSAKAITLLAWDPSFRLPD